MPVESKEKPWPCGQEVAGTAGATNTVTDPEALAPEAEAVAVISALPTTSPVASPLDDTDTTAGSADAQVTVTDPQEPDVVASAVRVAV